VWKPGKGETFARGVNARHEKREERGISLIFAGDRLSNRKDKEIGVV